MTEDNSETTNREELLEQFTRGIITGDDPVEQRLKELSAATKRINLENKTKHLNLVQSDRVRRKRKKTHPTTGSTKTIPVRWSSTGKRPERPDRKP